MNYYKLFNLNEYSTQDDIRSQYKKLVKKYHPDSSNYKDGKKFIELQQAYEYLLKNHHPKPIPIKISNIYFRILEYDYVNDRYYTTLPFDVIPDDILLYSTMETSDKSNDINIKLPKGTILPCIATVQRKAASINLFGVLYNIIPDNIEIYIDKE